MQVRLINPNWIVRFRFFPGQGYVVDVWDHEAQEVIYPLFRVSGSTQVTPGDLSAIASNLRFFRYRHQHDQESSFEGESA